MQDPTKPLTDIITNALNAFKAGDYDGVQDILRSSIFKKAIEGLDPKAYMKDVLGQSLNDLINSDAYKEKLSQALSSEQLQKITTEALSEIVSSKTYKEKIQMVNALKPLKETALNWWEHMGVATRPDIRERLDEKALQFIHSGIKRFEKIGKNDSVSPFLNGGTFFIGQEAAAASPTDQLHNALQGMVQNVARVLHKIDETRLAQADFITAFESALFEERGAIGYYGDVVQRRWLGDHHAGETLIDGIISSPTNVAECITVEGKALEEFGKVTILNTPLKQVGAGVASVAGVGLVAHGVHNVYRAFTTDPQEKLELVELNHERPTNGVNRLQLAVGGGEIIAGIATLHRQLTGRWGVGAIKGIPDPLITHTTPSAQGRG